MAQTKQATGATRKKDQSTMSSQANQSQQQDIMNDATDFNEDDDSPMNNVATMASSLLASQPPNRSNLGQPHPRAGLAVRAAGSATITVTETPPMASVQGEILQLTLRGLPRVTWYVETLARFPCWGSRSLWLAHTFCT
jgi:hypothetical protein